MYVCRWIDALVETVYPVPRRVGCRTFLRTFPSDILVGYIIGNYYVGPKREKLAEPIPNPHLSLTLNLCYYYYSHPALACCACFMCLCSSFVANKRTY